jgi:hypothetical protein
MEHLQPVKTAFPPDVSPEEARALLTTAAAGTMAASFLYARTNPLQPGMVDVDMARLIQFAGTLALACAWQAHSMTETTEPKEH